MHHPGRSLTTVFGKRRISASRLRRVVDETWALGPSPATSAPATLEAAFFCAGATATNGNVLVANVSDGGRDCRRQNNNNRLDTRSIQSWINDTLRQRP